MTWLYLLDIDQSNTYLSEGVAGLRTNLLHAAIIVADGDDPVGGRTPCQRAQLGGHAVTRHRRCWKTVTPQAICQPVGSNLPTKGSGIKD